MLGGVKLGKVFCLFLNKKKMQDHIKYALLVFFSLAGLLLLSRMPTMSATRGEKITADQIRLIGDDVKRLYYMSKQDQNPLLAVLHATIALSKLQTLKIIGPANRISKKLDLDVDALKEEILATHRQKIQEINTKCPSLKLLDDGVDWFF